MKLRVTMLAAATALAMAGPAAAAAQIFATSYDTPNGDGQAHSGLFNYWGLAYTGAGATNVDGAALTGGLGDLTDGVLATDYWYNTENDAGSGPYVGWRGDIGVANPLITFDFAGNPLIDTILIHFDNSHVGGVATPAQILVDGVSQSFTDLGIGTFGNVTLSGLGLTGGSHTIQFVQDATFVWTFVSEISFFGQAVPEPGTWTLMIGGFALAGAALRRRRSRALV